MFRLRTFKHAKYERLSYGRSVLFIWSHSVQPLQLAWGRRCSQRYKSSKVNRELVFAKCQLVLHIKRPPGPSKSRTGFQDCALTNTEIPQLKMLLSDFKLKDNKRQCDLRLTDKNNPLNRVFIHFLNSCSLFFFHLKYYDHNTNSDFHFWN